MFDLKSLQFRRKRINVGRLELDELNKPCHVPPPRCISYWQSSYDVGKIPAWRSRASGPVRWSHAWKVRITRADVNPHAPPAPSDRILTFGVSYVLLAIVREKFEVRILPIHAPVISGAESRRMKALRCTHE